MTEANSRYTDAARMRRLSTGASALDDDAADDVAVVAAAPALDACAEMEGESDDCVLTLSNGRCSLNKPSTRPQAGITFSVNRVAVEVELELMARIRSRT